jgi:hypothetical protein
MARISSARRPVSIRVQLPVATGGEGTPFVALLPIAARRVTELDPHALGILEGGRGRSIVLQP